MNYYYTIIVGVVVGVIIYCAHDQIDYTSSGCLGQNGQYETWEAVC